jgi:profilin
MSKESRVANIHGPQHTLTRGTVPSHELHPIGHRSTDHSLPNSLVGTGNVDKAAIFSSAGDSVWATSAGFTVDPKEIQAVVAAYNDKGDVKQCQSTGLYIAGERYVVIKADERSIYGKKVSREAS